MSDVGYVVEMRRDAGNSVHRLHMSNVICTSLRHDQDHETLHHVMKGTSDAK